MGLIFAEFRGGGAGSAPLYTPLDTEAGCRLRSVSSSSLIVRCAGCQPSVTEHFRSPPLVSGTVFHSTSSRQHRRWSSSAVTCHQDAGSHDFTALLSWPRSKDTLIVPQILDFLGFENWSSQWLRIPRSLHSKKRMVKAFVWSAALHGSETWTLQKEDIRRLEAFEIWIWRRMMKVPWTENKTNEEILHADG